MKTRLVVLLATLLAVGWVSVPAATASASDVPSSTAVHEAVRDTFPHLRHQGLFPFCTGCHEGIPEGNVPEQYPEPGSCAGCHDGVTERRVDWVPEVRPVGLVEFSHPQHIRRVERHGEPEVECAQCHVAEGGERMEVVALDPVRCFTCHGNAEQEHFDPSRNCAQCHRNAAEAPGVAPRLGTFDQPTTHGADDFLLTHAPTTPRQELTCATCHVQQRCTACHVDPGLAPIQRMPQAPTDWTLPLMRAEYPVPSTHVSPFFERDHGRPAPNASDCSTCHTQDDCAACHLEPLPPSAEGLLRRPAPHPGSGAGTTGALQVTRVSLRHDTLDVDPRYRGPGVGLVTNLPRSHESAFFMASHQTVAAAAPESCATCHTENYCASCHDAPQAPGFHPSNFATRHAAAASAMSAECANCHNTQAFCRQCHVEMGFGTEGRLGPGYHDAEPLWLIRHGQGARQGLEQCVTCHTQKDCLQCHSQVGAFKVSPHGPDFDPAAARSRNPYICTACHLGNPGGG